MSLPFIEQNIKSNIFIREFSSLTDSIEFAWHRDKEDRIVESIENTDWEIQIDNQLPQSLNGKVFIPKETYHRLIKGTGDLKITLIKLESVNEK